MTKSNFNASRDLRKDVRGHQMMLVATRVYKGVGMIADSDGSMSKNREVRKSRKIVPPTPPPPPLHN